MGESVPHTVKFWVMYVILFINIAEAIAKDGKGGDYLNAIAGLLNIAAMPYSPNHLYIEKEKSDMMWEPKRSKMLAHFWNWGYTIWNFTFCYNTYGDKAGGMRTVA